jgi:3',5'-cyclic AMP phosphodiesterase CpdA
MKITFISDTHSKHNQITDDLPGGNLLIHAGDMSSMGYNHEIQDFCKWFDSINNYDFKVFIAGNHDWGFIDREQFFVHRSVVIPKSTEEILNLYKNIDYLRDSSQEIQIGDNPSIKIYGSPWQPEFFDWAFNLPRKGDELKNKWNDIPTDTDILITHGPAYGYVDRVVGRTEHLGCELLTDRIKEIKPKIHVCGHIHSGFGYVFDGNTHYINASLLNEQYRYTNKPLTIDWDSETNEIEFL